MNKKGYFISILISIIVIGLYTISFIYDNKETNINTLYKVYLSGEVLGYIEDDNELYELINKEQEDIKDKYNVENVYPPADFEMVKVNTYYDKTTEVEEIYKLIEENGDFTVKGYTVTIKPPESSDGAVAENIYIHLLDKELFNSAVDSLVKAFIDEEKYTAYINDNQDEIVDEGEIINSMYFLENISIKEDYVSAKIEYDSEDSKIYTSESELTQYLLFGSNAQIETHTVKTGDTIINIASDNKLSTQEFLIANPIYQDESTLLLEGEEVFIALTDPLLNFVYQVRRVYEADVDYLKKTVTDNTLSYGSSQVTTPGVTGIDKITEEYYVTNGQESQAVDTIEREVIREPVDQVTTKGPSAGGGSSSVGSSLTVNINFYSPLPSGARVTSPFGVYRWGDLHLGTDYSGTGEGSSVYAIADGVVTQAAEYCGYNKCSRWTSGTYVVIDHGNNYYSSYLHMVKGSLKVDVGQTVSGGQQIGQMGNTGWSTGAHLHLAFSLGEPYAGVNVVYYNVHKLIYGS